MEQGQKTPQRIFLGEVVSDKMDKSLVVKTERMYKHSRIGKVMRSFKKHKVHDEKGEAKVGDIVEFYAGRPVSKTKCMYLLRVVKSSSRAQ